MLLISAGIFDDKLRPQILSVGTTANAALIGQCSWSTHSVNLKSAGLIREVAFSGSGLQEEDYCNYNIPLHDY
jgi:hypothetical protein